MAFAQKLLRLTFTLAQGATFAGTSSDTLTLSGLKTQASISNVGQLQGCQLTLAVYGLTLSQMNDLSTLGPQLGVIKRNIVKVEASIDNGGWSAVFEGVIQTAFADLQGMPDAVLRVTANSIAALVVEPVEARSINGAVNVAGVLQLLAAQATPPLNFENNAGVNVILRNPYLWGSVHDCIKELCEAAGINWVIQNHTLAIWPRNGSRTPAGMAAPIVSSATGLVASPTYTAFGLLLKTLFNPAVLFGGAIQVQSALTTNAAAQGAAVAQALKLPVDGIYQVVQLNHELESWVPNGHWFSSIYASTTFVVPPA